MPQGTPSSLGKCEVIKQYGMKTYGASGSIDLRFLYLSTSWESVVNFTDRKLSPPGVGPRAGLDDMKKIIFLLYLDSNSDPSVVQPVGSRYTDEQRRYYGNE
jgi:hypothetical protein